MILTPEQIIEKYNLDADISKLDLSEKDLKNAELSYANLSGSNLSGALLTHASLFDANLSDTDLSRATLVGAELGKANLTNANLSGAYLYKADLSGANLSGANLTGVCLKDVSIDRIVGKEIITFSAGKDFAYYADGILRIGYESRTPQKWIDDIESEDTEIGWGYTDREKELYLEFIKLIITVESSKNEIN